MLHVVKEVLINLALLKFVFARNELHVFFFSVKVIEKTFDIFVLLFLGSKKLICIYKPRKGLSVLFHSKV